jgi:uncharacterized protein YbaR (Trm112 family)/ubiquinone/menaquinone biosynthesis C-methylase UbiE
MTPELLKILCQPGSQAPLTLREAAYDSAGQILSGLLTAPDGSVYPIVNGIPRFVQDSTRLDAVESFGEEWNYFNFSDFEAQWLAHTVQNTFGSRAAFAGKTIVDAGGGSGAQTKWMLESGAKHVILLELSNSVDDVVKRNLVSADPRHYDVIQCSIDQPPLRALSIDGIVLCHNVIQHTPSVEATARALYALVGPGGEFVFNCYPLNDQGLLRWIRFHLVFQPLRALLSRCPFQVILAYSRLSGALSLIPGLGRFIEKAGLIVTGEVLPDARGQVPAGRRFKATALNTFDAFGGHSYQHYKRDAEIRDLVHGLQPNPEKVTNLDRYFQRPPAIGCAIRVSR